MRTDLTSSFLTAVNRTSSMPVSLLQLDWPALNGFPALTLRLADRALTIGGTSWLGLVEAWKTPDNVSTARATSDRFDITLLNGPVDFGSGPERFSELIRRYPLEAATATLYYWFENESLDEFDLAWLFTAQVTDPIVFDEFTFSFRLQVSSRGYGERQVGDPISLNDYANAPEQSLSRIKPIVIGRVDQVRGILVRKTNETRLTSVALPGSTVLNVASTAGFPDSGMLVINDDEISFTGTEPTRFTGCTGISDFHYADDQVLEKVNDHRYLFSDPAWPIQNIQDVRVAGQLVDPGDYVVDLGKGEVVFSEKPRRVRSIDTKFLQAQFDQVASGNTALNASSALQPTPRTQYARISQATPKLKLKQTDAMPDIGQIGRVLLRVEHFVEEQLPNDSIAVRFPGIAELGTLSPPATDDRAQTTGSTDISHNHLDDFGFPIDLPQPVIVPTSQADHVIEQGASSGPAGALKIRNALWAGGGQTTIAVTFPPLPAGATKAEYQISWKFVRQDLIGGITPQLKFGGQVIGTWDPLRNDYNYTSSFTTGGPGGNTWFLTLTHGELTFDLLSAKRLVFYPHNTAASQGAQQTVKGGSTIPLSSSPSLTSNTEKATQTVVDFFDITSLTNSDWSWFNGREVEVEYQGQSDGRTVFVLHVAFEIEYARRRLETTDDVIARVDGIQDDALGTITGTPYALIERPDHVFTWSLISLLQLGSSLLEMASFSAAGVKFENAIPGGYALAGVVNARQRIQELWDQWMLSSRALLWWDAQGRARLLFRPFNNTEQVEGLEVRTLTDANVMLDAKTSVPLFTQTRSQFDEVVTRFDPPYKRDWSRSGQEFLNVISVGDPLQEQALGVLKPSAKFSFDWCQTEEQAQQLAEFYLADFREPRTLVECALLPGDLDLEVGDIVKLDSTIGNLNQVFGQVQDTAFYLGGSTEADRVNLLVHLFPIAFLTEQVSESAEVEDALLLLLAFFIEQAESIESTEAFLPVHSTLFDGGIDVGDARWDEVQSNGFESINVVSQVRQLVQPLWQNGAGVTDAVFINSAGFGIQSYALTGYGGKELLA